MTTPTETTSPVPPTSSSTGPTSLPTIQPGGEARSLDLTDFFNPESSWEEGLYGVADTSNIAGMAHSVSRCGLDYYDASTALELRLENRFDNLSFKVGQGNLSEASNQRLSVAVVANERQVSISSVPFNEIQSVEVPVTAVNALQIQMSLDDDVEDCGSGDVTAVIFEAALS